MSRPIICQYCGKVFYTDAKNEDALRVENERLKSIIAELEVANAPMRRESAWNEAIREALKGGE